MSLSNTVVGQLYNGDGAVVDFAIPFDTILDTSTETKVWLRDFTTLSAITETLLTEGVEYTLTGAPLDNVRMGVAPTVTQKLLVTRGLSLTQLIDFIDAAATSLERNEEGLDKTTALAQQLEEIFSRVPTLPITHRTNTPFNLPDPDELSQTVVWGFEGPANTFKYFTIDELAILINDTFLQKSANLSDVASAAASRVNLDLGGLSAQRTAVILNSVGPVDFGSLQLDGDVITSAWIWMEIVRGSTHTTRLVPFHFKGSAWIVENDLLSTNDLDGLVFSTVVVAGNIYKVQYTSDASGAGTAKYKEMKFDV